jgi:tripartite-type tricarboxylate transporter receptor subunit TctC
MKYALKKAWRGLLLAVALCMVNAHAEWPEHPVRIVVPTPAGGAADTIARAIGNALSASFGQSVVILNRPGAAGNIGTVQVARSPADGYTFLMSSVSMAVNPSLYANIGYDPLKDLTPVAMAGIVPNVFFVHPDVKVSSLAELLTLTRTEKLAYASPGNGTSSHLAAELMFRVLAKTDILHVPYAPATSVTAVLGAQVQVGVAAASSVVPMVKSGRLKALAVTSAHRSSQLPDVPTVGEASFAGFDASTWFVLFAPSGVPAHILDKLNESINAAVASSDLKKSLEQQSIETSAINRLALQSFVKSEVGRWSVLVRDLGIKAN